MGIAGAAVAGILAVIMSTADSYLNASSISLVNDVIKPLTKQTISDKNELRLARFLTVGLGVIAVVIALKLPNMIDLIVFYITISWAPLVVAPLYACIFDFRTSVRSFIVAGIFGLGTRLLLPLCVDLSSEIIVTTATIFASAFGLIGSHYFFIKRLPRFGLRRPDWRLPRVQDLFSRAKKYI